MPIYLDISSKDVGPKPGQIGLIRDSAGHGTSSDSALLIGILPRFDSPGSVVLRDNIGGTVTGSKNALCRGAAQVINNNPAPVGVGSDARLSGQAIIGLGANSDGNKIGRAHV